MKPNYRTTSQSRVVPFALAVTALASVGAVSAGAFARAHQSSSQADAFNKAILGGVVTPPASAGEGSVDLTPQNNWTGKLPDGTPVQVVCVRAADSLGAIHVFSPSGEPAVESGTMMPKPDLSRGQYELVIRVSGKTPYGHDYFLGESRYLGVDSGDGNISTTGGGTVVFEGILGKSSGVQSDKKSEQGVYLSYPNDQTRVVPDITFVGRRSDDDVLAKVDGKTGEVQLLQPEQTKVEFVPDADKVPSVVVGQNVRPQIGVKVETEIKDGDIEVRAQCADGEVAHGRLRGPMVRQAHSGLYTMPKDWNVASIQVIRHAYQTVKIHGLKLVRPKASA